MQYARHSLGSYLRKLFLVTLCISHLLLTRCSVVFDEKAQEARNNKYCSKFGSCLPGSHAMCRFGDKKMGPRCDSGMALPFTKEEKQHVVDIVNEYKRKLAKGQDDIIPRAYGMRKVRWDNTLAEFAQAWANQCNQFNDDICRDSEDDSMGKISQLVSVQLFNLDWSLTIAKTKDKVAQLTTERRKKFIEAVFKAFYLQKPNGLTRNDIEKHSQRNSFNPYLKLIHGSTWNIGCGMSSFLEYKRITDLDPIIYNALLIVCNLSNDPKVGEKLYETKWVDGADWTPCGCPKGFYEDDCLCVSGDRKKEDKPNDKDNTETDNSQKGDNNNNKAQKGDNSQGTQKGDNSKGNPKGDDSKEKKKGNKPNIHNTNDNKQKGDKNEDITKTYTKKEKGKNNGVISADTCAEGDRGCSPRVVIMPIIKVENADMTRLQESQLTRRRSQQLRDEIKERVQDVRDQFFKDFAVLDPGTILPNGGPVDEDTFILSKDLFKHGQDEEVLSNKKKTNIEIKSRRDFSDLDQLVSEYLLTLHNNNNEGSDSTSDTSHRSINNMRKSINPQENYQNSQTGRSTKLKQVSNDFASKGNLNKIVISADKDFIESITEDINKLQSSKKQMLKGDLMDKLDSENDDKGYPINISHKKRIIDEYIWRKRSQRPINSYKYDTNNYDYHVQVENGQGYRNIDPQPMLILDDYSEFENDEKSTYDGQNAPFIYDANEVAQFYLDRLNPGINLGLKLDTGPDTGRRRYSNIDKYRPDTGMKTRHRKNTGFSAGRKKNHKRPVHPKSKQYPEPPQIQHENGR